MANKRETLLAFTGLTLACSVTVAIIAVNTNTALEVINEYQDQSPAPPPTEVVYSSPAKTRDTPEGDVETITLALAGDVMLARLVNEAIRANGPLCPWNGQVSR